MAVSQTFTVSEVSSDASTNTSKVRIRWTSTQSGESWNGYTRTAYYWVSINGGAETQYSVSYTLPKGTTQTILDTTITVPHKDDGSGTVSARAWMDTRISAGVIEQQHSVTLTTFARASTIESVSAVTLGNKCSVRWTPKSSSLRYELKFSLGSWSALTGSINPNTTSAYTYTGYTIPLNVAEQITGSNKGKMTVTLYTYSPSVVPTQIGSTSSATFDVLVPETSATRPTVNMSLAPASSLSSAFAGLYIQGKTKVKATLGGTGKLGATIKSYSMKVGGTSYGSNASYTSGYLSNYGTIRVDGYATDSRGYTGSTYQDITVIAYSKPKITVDVCDRCDADGNLSDDGTYLKIKATRSYSTVTSNGVQKNFCKIQYRYKATSASSYSSWTTILASSNVSTNTVETNALLGGVLALDTSYDVQVQAIDDIGESAIATFPVSTEAVHTHRTRNGMGLGKYCEGENLLDVAWDAHFHGEVRIGSEGMTLREYILAVISEGG